MNHMFSECRSLTTFNLVTFNISIVRDMCGIFNGL